MQSKIISFWSPVSRSGVSTNTALFISYLSKVMNEMDKAVLFSLNDNVDSTDYITDTAIKEGLKKLKLLHSNGDINSKEDVFAYTHKISENIDVLGTNKDIDTILENFDLMIEILSESYDYIILDIKSGMDKISLDAISCSTVIVVCMPQDKYICEDFSQNAELLNDKKSIFLISQYDDKKALKKTNIEVVMQHEVYAINHNININQACYERNIYTYLNSKRSNNADIDKLYKEVERLVNTDNLNITYNINKIESKKADKIVQKSEDEPIKVVKEYKFIKAKNNIGILNLSQAAGATFITLNLACFLKEKKLNVTVAEIPHIEFNKHDIYSILNCHNEIPYVADGIKYYVNIDSQNEWTNEKIINYINTINRESNSVNLYDLGNADVTDSNINYLLNLLDSCIIVVDPLPYKLLQSTSRLEVIMQDLRDKGVDSLFVINKFIDDLSKKDIENYLNCNVISCIPFLKPETIYTAHYASKIAYKIEKNELLQDSLFKIVNKANIAIDLEKKRKNIFNIFRKE